MEGRGETEVSSHQGINKSLSSCCLLFLELDPSGSKVRISSPPPPLKGINTQPRQPRTQPNGDSLQKAKNLPKLSHVLGVFTFRWVAPGQRNKKLFHFPLSFYFLQKETDALPVLLYIVKSQMLLKKTTVLAFCSPQFNITLKKKKLNMVPR